MDELLEKADIDIETYRKILSVKDKAHSVILKRNPCECYINFYNPDLLLAWGANMDLQFVVDAYSCIVYITSYMMKAEGAMSELLSNVLKENDNEDIKTKMSKIGNSFLNNREVSAKESAYRILGLPLKYFTRMTVFINTSVPQKRVRLLKPASSLA